jgi:CRISPR/Cas system-associated endonuclease Cas1
MEIDDFQHPDSIWTWSSSARRGRASVWIPYMKSIEKSKGGWIAVYNGGDVLIDPAKVDSILLYGATGALPVSFLDDLAAHRVPLMVHRRNLPDPYVFVPGGRRDDVDILSAQVRARDNGNRCAYVARTLIRERFRATPYPIAESFFRELAATRSVTQVRAMEAEQSRVYWTRYFREAGLPEESRRSDNPLSAALDAGSFFVYGVLLRWVLLHRMSPAHGFLHVTTGYPSLVYDLMEPFRAFIERAAFEAHGAAPGNVTAATLQRLKDGMEEQVFVPSHRTTVRRKNLLHGVVLALRSWLVGESLRFVVPAEGPKIGGRPPRQGYRLPGTK